MESSRVSKRGMHQKRLGTTAMDSKVVAGFNSISTASKLDLRLKIFCKENFY